MVINISCKLDMASYNIFFVRAVMVKSLYTLRLSSGYNDLLNSGSLKVAITQLYHNIFTQNSLNAIVFKLQVILLMMEVTEKSKSSY